MAGQIELFGLPPSPDMAAIRKRHVVLGGCIVTYELRRDRRRLALCIDERGLRVGAPRSVTLVEIEAFVVSHGDWVLRKLDEFTVRSVRRHLPIHDGARLPVLGRDACVRVTPGPNRGYWRQDAGGEELWLAARPAADLSVLTRRALQRRAIEYFAPRVNAAAASLGRPAPALALSSARTRWGSCSTGSGIRLNWRLIHLPPGLIDYVIAHEVAHLVEMNHGAGFWAVVERLHPGWRTSRSELKRQGAGLPLV